MVCSSHLPSHLHTSHHLRPMDHSPNTAAETASPRPEQAALQPAAEAAVQLQSQPAASLLPLASPAFTETFVSAPRVDATMARPSGNNSARICRCCVPANIRACSPAAVSGYRQLNYFMLALYLFCNDAPAARSPQHARHAARLSKTLACRDSHTRSCRSMQDVSSFHLPVVQSKYREASRSLQCGTTFRHHSDCHSFASGDYITSNGNPA
jgi:hypothetical protein